MEMRGSSSIRISGSCVAKICRFFVEMAGNSLLTTLIPLTLILRVVVNSHGLCKLLGFTTDKICMWGKKS